MEKKMNHKSKSIQDILPLDLIHRILLRVPVRHLASLKCVSKRWYSLISDPLFAELHFHHSPAATKASVFMGGGSLAYFVYLDSLFTDNNDALQVKKVSLPFKMKKLPSDFEFLGSCRGFVLLHRDPHFLVVWNPLTGSGKRISYSHIVSRFKHKGFRLPCKFHLYGFGYDASQDDYLVFVAWQDKDDHYHFDCFSLRTNSWINLDAALSKPLDVCHRNSCGLFLNGAIHWVPYSLTTYRDAIIIFDMKERTFSRISGPEQPVMSACTFPTLALLGGCLALYYCNNDSCNTHIWVMKEYKVLSSWTLYQIPCKDFRPLCLSSNMDIIGRGYTLCGTVGYFIYNVREDLLKHFNDRYCWLPLRTIDPVYTESLLPLPDDIKEKDKKKNMKKSGDRAPSLTTAGLKGYFNKRKRAENQGSSTNADKEGKVLAEKVAALEKDVEKTNLEKEKLVAQVKELESLLSAKEADVCEVFIQGFDRAVLQIKTLLPEADVSAMDVTKVALNGELVDGEVLEEAVDENAAQQQGDEVVRV
ncbi:F-box/kelch-repeat protein At3g23880 [Arachis ipaensis]|uniref:F-box/kelch-repeat protein At3g23880 n=1 Tax=Arachis ipaensis TaxID=130454 RepID=UPI0007AF2A92|nr:F-box/kelch-repeat protein At3g23880 [Arachis ipaensis]XP_025650227.1 F-box/kelch-repeat protein At3g23880-like [Arachis hypogaea]XP_025650228.1 F-box/kelch-repeat protein At3g23880-like [Arachis hypogaea]XP_025650229.1 F-box/kelch-repeat protein At3g23880-like [Arachis hypogaea]XP_025650230.1 F-box/kelch-repeat protein At3g23880-like [Arachis hypogaea]XP_025650232.1 F-box/kelch-repeat protein At3g23880-like [Arachis hypogaea]XP_025696961.1 F-box/kelch-repeat protein At3g23880 [Arachis hyp